MRRWRLGRRLLRALNVEVFHRKQRHYDLTDVTDYDSATTADTKAYADYFGFMLDHGIYVAPSQFESMFVSDAHTDADIQKTIHVMQEYFAE